MGEDKSEVTRGRHRGRLRLFLLVSALVVALDQLSKLWVRANSPQIELLPGFLDLVLVRNDGAIFGLLSSQTGLLISLGIVGLLLILVFIHYFPPATTVGMLSFALILGGQVGNLIDRIHLGHVIDFIKFYVQGLFSWPAFNVADAAITVGIVTLIYSFRRSGVFTKVYEQNHRPQN
ncbi:MAG: signal peptidase II [Dehalococcoidia bacterium]